MKGRCVDTWLYLRSKDYYYPIYLTEFEGFGFYTKYTGYDWDDEDKTVLIAFKHTLDHKFIICKVTNLPESFIGKQVVQTVLPNNDIHLTILE